MGAIGPHQLPPYSAHKTQFIDQDQANRELMLGLIWMGPLILLALGTVIVLEFVRICVAEVVDAGKWMMGF